MRKTKLLMPAACMLALLASCAGEKKAAGMHAGSVWQNGQEVYIVEDSTSFWQLYGGTLHEGGYEMKLAKDGKWLVPTIADNQTKDSIAGTWQLDGDSICLLANGKKAEKLYLVEGLTVSSRNDIPAKALPALDSVQQTNVYRQLEGTYTDNNGKKWIFSGNTMQRMGLATKETYAIGKSLDMNDSVIFTGNIAYAYSLTPQGINLYKAKYLESECFWEYNKQGEKPIVVLKRQ